jgi:hypothetical protein
MAQPKLKQEGNLGGVPEFGNASPSLIRVRRTGRLRRHSRRGRHGRHRWPQRSIPLRSIPRLRLTRVGSRFSKMEQIFRSKSSKIFQSEDQGRAIVRQRPCTRPNRRHSFRRISNNRSFF